MRFSAKDKPQHNSRANSPQTREMQYRLLFSRRILIVLLGVIGAVISLLGRAYYLQVIKFEHYRTRSHKNRVKSQVIPPLRGNIFDRNGTALSENILTYELVVNRAKTENLSQLISQVANYMRFDEDDFARYQSDIKKKNYNQDVVVRTDLSEDEINHFLVDLHLFPGFDIAPAYKRYYPYGELTAHVVGYINNINQKDLQHINQKEYSGTKKIGRTGIEKYYEKELHGKAGFRQAEISRTGKIIRILEQKEPEAGQDLYLSLDLRLQKIIKDNLENQSYNGAGVAICPETGEVLAMHSNPCFDANLFVNGISYKDYEALRNSPRKNLFNRALNGKYPPASTIKPMMALAAMHEYLITPDMEIDCKGSYRIPDHKSDKRFFCWKRHGHGNMTAASSIVQSCDVYYYNIGKELGITRIYDYLSQFGLGRPTGIDLPSESSGILPSRPWKLKKLNRSWFIGDTINASIGQGYMLTTPLQLAYFTAVLAAKGKRFTPHFVTHYKTPLNDKKIKKDNPSLADVKQNNPHAWDTVSQALVDVMHARQGTAHKIKKHLPFKIAGKTGTAQVFSFRNNKRIKKDELSKHLRDNSVFITYAPAHEPKIALAVILENAGGGSEVAAPLAVKILEDYFSNKAFFEKDETSDALKDDAPKDRVERA